MFGTIHAGAAARCGAWIACVAVLLTACASRPETMPSGPAAISALRSETPPRGGETRILPSDRLDVHVLYEPDLSRQQLLVDAKGSIEMPLAGQIRAAGLTPHELGDVIQTKLARYLKTPRVDISVTSAASDHIIVEGNVNDPGVYDIAGSASLLEVLARAKSPNRTAALKQIVVFRQVDGQRVAAQFDLNRIRHGLDQDPTLYPGDTVVVGFSFIKGAFRDFLVAAPAIAAFRPY